MSRFFDDKVLSDDQICEESCKNGQVSPESRYNDYRNRLPFHYIEDGENDGYYYWTYGATMELSIILSDDVAWGEDQPAPGIEVDDKLSETSENPVQNKVITEALNGKLDKSTEKTILDQAYIKTAAGDNSRLNISIEQLPLTLVERDIHGHVMTSMADSEGQAVAYEQLEQRVPAGGKKGQNLTKKSDNDYDTYWANPDDINSIEHITLNGEEVPIEDKTANIKVDAKTIGFESTNVAYTDKENTFTEPQTFSYVDSDDPNWSEYAELGGSGANYSYTEYTDDTHKYSTSGEAYISSYVGRVMVGRSTIDEKGVSKNSIVLDVRKNWIARTEINAERVDGKLGTAVQTYYAYIFPKTYPNQNVTLATIEDLTAQFGALNIQNGEGQYSLIQKVAPSTTTDPNNYATGKEAVALGRYNKSYADRSMTVNYDNENYGMWSFVANTKNKNGNKDVAQENVQSNAMFGCANEIKVGIEGFVAGKSNVNYEGDRFNISGSENENHTNNVRMSGRKNKSLKEIKTPITSGGGGGGSTNPDTNPTEPTEPYDYTSNTGYADISGTENEVFAMGGRTRGVAGICYSPFGSTEGFWTKAGYLVEDTTKSTETEKYYKPQGLGAKAFGRATHAKEDFTVAGGEHSVALKKGANTIGYYTIANTEWGTAIGKFNVGRTNTLFEVGNGYAVFDAGRNNAFEVLEDGRAKVQTAPEDNDDVVRKLELDIKYDKTGGTIGGDVIITGDLTVNGTQHINDTENLAVKNAMIYSNSDGATLALLGGLGIKKNATDVYGIVYDPTSDSVKLGLGKSNANGVFTFNENEGQPVAIRDDSSKFTNNNLVKWDSQNYKFVDSGKSVEDLVNKLPDLLRSQAYVRNANGEDSGLAYTYTDEGNTLALRNASGQLQVSNPSQDKDATNKSYADNLNARYVSTSILGG